MIYLVIEHQQVEQVSEPTWEQIENTVRIVDGYKFKGFVLSITPDDVPNEPWITVSGGNQARVLVSYFDPRPTELADQTDGMMLMELDNTGDEIVMLNGNQYEPWEPQYCVHKETALKALRYFFEHQTFDPDLTWDRLLEENE